METVRVPLDLLLDDISDGAVRTYAVLQAEAGKKNSISITREKIAINLGRSVSFTSERLRELDESGWVNRTQETEKKTHQFMPAVYTLNKEKNV